MTQLTPRNAKSLIPSVFSDFFDNDNFLSPKWMNWMGEETIPAVNIKENDTQFLIEMAAPGFEKKDFKVSVDADVLSISADKKQEDKEEVKKEEENYRRREFSFQSFSRSFRLPKSVTPDGIEAAYDKGMLQLRVPKKEASAPSNAKEIAVA